MTFLAQLYENLEFLAIVAVFMFFLQTLSPHLPKQKLWLRTESQLNLQYFLFYSIFASALIGLYELVLNSIGSSFFNQTPESAYLTEMNIFTKSFLALVLIDFIGYWQHRLFHNNTFLWKCHATHHSPREMDWLASNRVHVVETIIFMLVQYLIVHGILGFSLEIIAFGLILRGYYAYIVHANLNWTYGLLGYIFASPIFHRWHHSREKKYINKNYGGIFSAWDYIFGTAIMPDKKDILLGINENIGQNLFTHMVSPIVAHKQQQGLK